MKSKLYLVSVPIGNYEDISLRALRILKEVDYIVCEEMKPARRLLAHLKIQNELLTLNEHNENDSAQVVLDLLGKGKTIALISDAGTPLFSDPGHHLVKLVIKQKYQIIPIPGANSLIPALVSSGLDIEKFYYYGWLSPKKDLRKSEFAKLKKTKHLLVLLETPYRLQKLISEVVEYFGKEQHIVLAYKLTMNEENILRGKAKNVFKEVEKQSLKGEFVLLIDNRN